MDANAAVYLAVVLGVVVGLAVLLVAEAAGAGTEYVVGGGVIVLAAMGLLTYALARLEDGEAVEH